MRACELCRSRLPLFLQLCIGTMIREHSVAKSPSPRHKTLPCTGGDEGDNAAISDANQGKKSSTFSDSQQNTPRRHARAD